MSRAKELAEAHWSYISALLETHGLSGEQLQQIGFHYKTAMIHGYKHGCVDSQNKKVDSEN